MFMEAPDHGDIQRFLAAGRELRSASYTTALRRGVAVVSDVTRRAIRTFVRNRRRNAYLRSLHSLNDHTLKDIGLHRSEIHSVVSELVDEVPPSRVRARFSTTPCGTKTAANSEWFGEVA